MVLLCVNRKPKLLLLCSRLEGLLLPTLTEEESARATAWRRLDDGMAPETTEWLAAHGQQIIRP